MKKYLIDQKKNYKADYGFINRSSAIFYVINKKIKTSISILNYWKIKNNVDVTLLITYRNLNGSIVDRKVFNFENSNVINLSNYPFLEGSVEIEAFGKQNLRIPYAAVMCMYENTSSISQIHSYTRNHSLIEIENNEAFTNVFESCWTTGSIKENTKYILIFHNGHSEIESQVGELILTNSQGKDKKIKIRLKKIKKFETVKLDYTKYLKKYKKFFGNNFAYGSINFKNYSSFSRLMHMKISKSEDDLQVTHTNFNYSIIDTNFIKENQALMKIPNLSGDIENYLTIVYPKYAKGNYTAFKNDKNKILFKNNTPIVFKNNSKSKKIIFQTQKKHFPSRIVTGLFGSIDDTKIPFECSLGIVHPQRRGKRFQWGTVGHNHDNKIFLENYKEFYEIPKKIILTFRLYSSENIKYLEKKIKYKNLELIPRKFHIKELFKNFEPFLNNSYGYMSLWSNFEGFIAYSLLKKNKSVSIEHFF